MAPKRVVYRGPNPRNPRKHFKSEEIEALAGSIRQRGIVQPILVRPVADQPSAYEIVAGERRWRAAQVACLHEVPVIVVEIDDRTSLDIRHHRECPARGPQSAYHESVWGMSHSVQRGGRGIIR